MASSDKALQELSHAKYWDQRYAAEKKSTGARETDEEDDGVRGAEGGEGQLGSFEWFRTFTQIKDFLANSMPPPSDELKLLHLGCGNSTLPADLHALSYRNQLAVDFSQVVIDAMSLKYAHLPELKWAVMDIRSLTLPDSSIDVAIDKGTLDAMIHGSLWDPPEDVRINVEKYCDEVERVLKDGGKWIYITFRQPHFMRPLLAREGVWTAECRVLGGQGEGMFEYFGWVMTRLGGEEVAQVEQA